MREVIVTGKTVEEATEAGCAQLGLSRDEVSVEILEMPVKKLFKTSPAKVRITSDDGKEEAAPAPAQPQMAAPAPVVVKPDIIVQKTEEKRPQKAEKKTSDPQEPEVPIDLSQDSPAKTAAEYLTSIFTAMGASDVNVFAFQQGDATMLRVEGESIQGLIDTRGETLQALSYLTDRAVNKGVDKKSNDYMRVRLDVAGYRGRREGELVSLAERTAEEVNRTKRSRTLAPMNPYERLIVHTTISEIEGVRSESIGADTERRVVVKSTAPDATDGEDWRPPRKQGGSGGGGRRPQGQGGGRPGSGGGPRGRKPGSGGGRGRGDNAGKWQKPNNTPEREYADKKPEPGSEPIVPQRRDAIRDGDDLPLYGKIEL